MGGDDRHRQVRATRACTNVSVVRTESLSTRAGVGLIGAGAGLTEARASRVTPRQDHPCAGGSLRGHVPALLPVSSLCLAPVSGPPPPALHS